MTKQTQAALDAYRAAYRAAYGGLARNDVAAALDAYRAALALEADADALEAARDARDALARDAAADAYYAVNREAAAKVKV